MTSKTDPNEYKSKDKVCELHGYSMAARQRATIRGAMGCKTRSKSLQTNPIPLFLVFSHILSFHVRNCLHENSRTTKRRPSSEGELGVKVSSGHSRTSRIFCGVMWCQGGALAGRSMVLSWHFCPLRAGKRGAMEPPSDGNVVLWAASSSYFLTLLCGDQPFWVDPKGLILWQKIMLFFVCQFWRELEPWYWFYVGLHSINDGQMSLISNFWW
jgi:hypothetical protein